MRPEHGYLPQIVGLLAASPRKIAEGAGMEPIQWALEARYREVEAGAAGVEKELKGSACLNWISCSRSI